jgi:hypothetical protein
VPVAASLEWMLDDKRRYSVRKAAYFGMAFPVVMAVTALIQADESTNAPAGRDQSHVMQQLLDLADQREEQVKNWVRDYTCLIVKRERIHGTMQEHRFIQAKVRGGSNQNGQSQPLAVHLKFLKPAEVANREVIYVDGTNNGEMVVRRGGTRLEYVVTNVDPDSDLARTESLMHVSHLGFDGMLSEIVAHLRRDIAADPNGENTNVRISREAKINDRPCTSVVIVHPKHAEGLTYHRAEFFIDNEYHLPIRVAAYDWPQSEGATPELLAEFTYTQIKTNVGLSDADFDVEALRTANR